MFTLYRLLDVDQRLMMQLAVAAKVSSDSSLAVESAVSVGTAGPAAPLRSAISRRCVLREPMHTQSLLAGRPART